jgi:hypothetical protein
MRNNGVDHPPAGRAFSPCSEGKIADGFQSKIPADNFWLHFPFLPNVHKWLGPWHHPNVGAKT